MQGEAITLRPGRPCIRGRVGQTQQQGDDPPTTAVRTLASVANR